MTERVSHRRSFLTGLGVSAVGIGALGATVGAQAPAAGSRFQPAAHTADDWMDQIPGKHRVVIDGVSANGAGDAFLFANNLYDANQKGYGLGERDLAIIVVLRHFATAFAFTDAIWAKYGKPMGELLKFDDPNTKQPPTINVYNSTAYGMALPNFGNTIDSLVKRGTRFAICDAATHFMAQQLAGQSGNADAIYKELVASAIPNSTFVSAGVVGVTRAQERGYALIYAG
jgi:intracellular sulfur oxidation DsrE/DsrF family protein